MRVNSQMILIYSALFLSWLNILFINVNFASGSLSIEMFFTPWHMIYCHSSITFVCINKQCIESNCSKEPIRQNDSDFPSPVCVMSHYIRLPDALRIMRFRDVFH